VRRMVTFPRVPMKAWVALYAVALFLAASSFFAQVRVEAATTAPVFITGATTTDVGKQNTVDLVVPTGTLSGHVMIAHIVSVSTIAAPSGSTWTLVGSQQASSGGEIISAVYSRIANATDEAGAGSNIYSWANAGSDRSTGSISTFSGVDTTTALTVIDASNQAPYAATLTPVTPSITPSEDNTMLMAFFAHAVSTSFTPATFAELFDIQAGGNTITAERAFLAQGTAALVSETSTALGNDLGTAHLIAL